VNREARSVIYPTLLTPKQQQRLSRSFTVAMSGCWIAKNQPHPRGYSSITFNARRLQLHRLMFIITHGPLPAAWDVDHLCRTPRCVNPGHLEAVTHAENIRRAYRPAATS
jgi:hypothetical protein